eukprot:6172154-Pleurochrysis_carterae.AAC.1
MTYSGAPKSSRCSPTPHFVFPPSPPPDVPHCLGRLSTPSLVSTRSNDCARIRSAATHVLTLARRNVRFVAAELFIAVILGLFVGHVVFNIDAPVGAAPAPSNTERTKHARDRHAREEDEERACATARFGGSAD